mgnify:FL=1
MSVWRTDAKSINQEGLLEKVLNDNGVKLNRLQLELLDIIYCGDSKDLQDWKITHKKDKITPSLCGIISKLIENLGDNCPYIHIYETQLCSKKLQEEELEYQYAEDK